MTGIFCIWKSNGCAWYIDMLYTHLINFFMNHLIGVLNIGTLHRSSRMKTLKSLGNLVQVHLELCTTENGGEVM